MAKPFLRLTDGTHVEQFTYTAVAGIVENERWIPEAGPISHSGIPMSTGEALSTIVGLLNESWTVMRVE